MNSPPEYNIVQKSDTVKQILLPNGNKCTISSSSSFSNGILSSSSLSSSSQTAAETKFHNKKVSDESNGTRATILNENMKQPCHGHGGDHNIENGIKSYGDSSNGQRPTPHDYISPTPNSHHYHHHYHHYRATSSSLFPHHGYYNDEEVCHGCNEDEEEVWHGYNDEEEEIEDKEEKGSYPMSGGKRNMNEITVEDSHYYNEIERNQHDTNEERKGGFSGEEGHLQIDYPDYSSSMCGNHNNNTEDNIHNSSPSAGVPGLAEQQQQQANSIRSPHNNNYDTTSYSHQTNNSNSYGAACGSGIRNFHNNMDHYHHHQQQQHHHYHQNPLNLAAANTINQIVTMESVPFAPLPIPPAYRSHGYVYIDGAVKKLQLVTMQQTGHTYCMLRKLVFEKARVMIVLAGRVRNNVYPSDPYLYILEKLVVIKKTSLRQLLQSKEQNAGILIENPYDEIFAMVHIGSEENVIETTTNNDIYDQDLSTNFSGYEQHNNHYRRTKNGSCCSSTTEKISANVGGNGGNNTDSNHVCKILDYAQDEDFLYTVLPYLPRNDLYHLMKTRNKPLSESVAKDYFRQTLCGLRELKRKNICHRDLSLENLMFDRNGKIKIIDFGMCLQIPTYQVTHVIPYAIDMEGSEQVYAEQMALMINHGKSVANGGLLIASPTETEADLFSPSDGCPTFDSIQRQHEKDDNCLYAPHSHEGPSTADSLNDMMNCNQSMFGPESKDINGEDLSWVVVHGEEKMQNKGNLDEDLDTLVDATYSSSQHRNENKESNYEDVYNERGLPHEEQPTPMTCIHQNYHHTVERNQSQSDRTTTNSSYERPDGLSSKRTPSLMSSLGGRSPVTDYMKKNSKVNKSTGDIVKDSQFHQSTAEDQNKARQVQQFRTIIETKHAWCKAEARRGKSNYISPEIARETPFDGFAVDMWSIGIILYIMLTVTPLYSSSHDKAFELILNGELNRLLDHYETWGLTLSPLARDLVLKLLEVDPRKRITLEEAFEHPWLACDRDTERDQVNHDDQVNDTVLRESTPRHSHSQNHRHHHNHPHHQNISTHEHTRHDYNSNLNYRGHVPMSYQQRCVERCNIGG